MKFKNFKRVLVGVLAFALVIASIPFSGSLVSVKADELSNGLTATEAVKGETYKMTFAGLDGSDYRHTPGTSLGLVTFVKNTANNGAHGLTMNDGAEITVKVAGPCTITVSSCLYANESTILYMNGEQGQKAKVETDGDTLTYEYTGGAGEVTFSAVDGTTWIHEITVTPNPYVATTTTWNFDKSNTNYSSAYELALQGANNGTGTFEGLEIDATNGKLAARDSDAQANVGTKITIPVGSYSNYTLNVLAYNGATMSVGGETLTTTASSSWNNYSVTGTTDEDTESIVLSFDSSTYIKEISLTEARSTDPTQAGNGKIDVVDFGAEQLDGEVYNNLLTESIQTAFYDSSIAAGTSGVNIGDFTIYDTEGNEFIYFCAGGKTNNRYRTTNTNLTRYDEKSKKDADGNEYKGYIYSNNSPTDSVYMNFTLVENDVLTLMLGSNGGDAIYYLVSPSGNIQTFNFTNSAGVEEATFYAAEAGTYKLYCTNEKLVIARATRVHTAPVKISGTSTYADPEALGTVAPTGYSLVFTNKQTGGETVAAVAADGSYSCFLYQTYDYTVSLKDANGYVIATEDELSVSTEAESLSMDFVINPVELVTITGNITGIDADAAAKVQLAFNADKIYVPELTVNSDLSYTLKVEAGVTYEVVATDAADYTLLTTSIETDGNSVKDIEFVHKDTFDATITLSGISSEDAANAVITLTNINDTYEDGTSYVYTYNYGDQISLRAGQYSVKVTGVGNYAYEQAPTYDLKLGSYDNTADKTGNSVEVKFYDVTDWDFSVYNKEYDGNGIETINGSNYYYGLTLNSNVLENKTYLLLNESTDAEGNTVAGTIDVPVKAGDIVTLSYCYSAYFTAGDVALAEKSGSTSKIEKTQLVASQDGYMTIKSNGGQTYFTEISVVTPTEYKSVITVGADKEYQTINDALDAARTMQRTEDQEVTIVIDPGTYQEMLVIDVDNVNLVNAAGSAASTDLTNSGVDIADNAVRITSYYGHGYAYYSMDKNCKYNADLLDVNTYNGYYSFQNPGSGTTNGSYWNATVVVYADGFSADGIIFENSFNQYQSELAANDTIVALSGAKGESNGARNDYKVGSTAVQAKAYVERAAALAIVSDVSETYFDNCKFIGRQDTLYGGVNSTVVFDQCQIYGGTDYIFGGMEAIFYQCDLVANTSEDANDTFYITAAQQSSGRGYLMYECTVTSTTPGVDTASTKKSKQGYFGRPWQANTAEVVFYNTTIETTDFYDGEEKLLICDEGWNSSLGGKSTLSYEYGSVDVNGNSVDTSSRVSWSTLLSEAVLNDGTAISFANFVGNDWSAELLQHGKLTSIEYEMLNGENAEVAAGESVVFRSAADLSTFEGVEVDGVTVDPSNYTATSGSTIIELSADYLATLGEGMHTVTILSTDGAASTLFTLLAAEPSTEEPSTEEPSTENTTGEVAADTDVVVADATTTTASATEASTAASNTSEVAAEDTDTADNNNFVIGLALASVSAAIAAGAVAARKKEEEE
ncbi:pectinesterase family protein [Lachnospira pectinoschiza]|uniref:Exo-poly-alpha-galacturonosidase n=1 Tax=Lachnospira pectinoschiza TaxID=28052 RepID=A0A1G9XU83_9FIRM|nr:pectinesterase family protein [Lachnospira pectinoschiza]SDM99735.1 exo-poly-alpha-galacturonosidase [Lachnospira pectinoschiza]